MRNIILSTDLNGKNRILVIFFFVHLSVFWPFDLAIVSHKRCNRIMDVNFYLFIVYQMYQYTVSDINRGTIFLRKLKTRDRYSLAVQLSSEKIIKFAPRKLFVI